jgi:hypothetical protein
MLPSEMRPDRRYKVTFVVTPKTEGPFNGSSMGCRVVVAGQEHLWGRDYLYLSDASKEKFEIEEVPCAPEPLEDFLILVEKDSITPRTVVVYRKHGLWKAEGWNSRSWDLLLELFKPEKWKYKAARDFKELGL